MLQIKRRKIQNIFDAVFRHIIQKFFGRRTVRVNKSHTVAALNVLNGHIFQHRGLANAGFSNNINMAQTVTFLDAKTNFLIARIRLGKICDGIGVHLILLYNTIIIFEINIFQKFSKTLHSRLENNDERKEARSTQPLRSNGRHQQMSFARGLWSEDDCFLER